MPEDIFDVVDASDAVVGRERRSVVHAKKLFHRSAHVLVFCDLALGGRHVLLQRRSAKKDLYPLLYTTSVSGHVDSGETYLQAALREMREELGIEPDSPAMRYLGKLPPSKTTANEFTAVYRYFCPFDTRFAPPPDEVDALLWLPVAEFERQIAASPQNFTPSFLEVYKFYKSGGF